MVSTLATWIVHLGISLYQSKKCKPYEKVRLLKPQEGLKSWDDQPCFFHSWVLRKK